MFDEQNEWIDAAQQFKGSTARVQELVQQLTSHLHSLTACDCSLMLTIRRFESLQHIEEKNCEVLSRQRCFVLDSYLVQVSLIDLDKKVSSHLTANFERDTQLMQKFVFRQADQLQTVR